MRLIWAIGQTFGSYNHQPASGLERGEASIPDFYRLDEVKYHGKLNRGHTMVNFFEKPIDPNTEKTNELKVPNDCISDDCDYKVQWQITEDLIEIIVTSKAEDDEWIGIGFSKNSVMVCVYLSISAFAELMASSLSKREPRNAILFE